MRCEFCGGDLSLEMAYCPYCGKPNKHAIEHVRDMKEYQQDYEETKSDVQEKAHRFTGTTVRLIIVALLMILIIATLVLGGNSYSIRRKVISTRTDKNAQEVMKQMDTYLEEEDFIAFTIYCDENYVNTFETVFEIYMPVERAATNYWFIYSKIMEIACRPEYMDLERSIETLADSLDAFYKAADKNEYQYYDGIDWDKNNKALLVMEEKIELFLQSYCGLTKEEADGIKTMSVAKRAVLIEEAILNE